MNIVKPIYPCLWYNNNGKEAILHYQEVFNTKPPTPTITGEQPPVTTFNLAGNHMIALDGGTYFKHNQSISLFLECVSVEQAAEYWEKLITGSVHIPLAPQNWSPLYGWGVDSYGIHWQISAGHTHLAQDEINITPSLLFTNEVQGQAAQAIDYYHKVFGGELTMRVHADENDLSSQLLFANFTLGKNHTTNFIAMEGPTSEGVKFSEAFSFTLECAEQKDIDYYWDTITRDGQESMCGWCKDRYGVSWQIIPSILGELMSDPKAAPKVSAAFLQMKKMDILAIKQAAGIV